MHSLAPQESAHVQNSFACNAISTPVYTHTFALFRQAVAATGGQSAHQPWDGRRTSCLCRPSVVQKWGSGVRRPGSVGPAIDPVRRTRAGTERELSGEQQPQRERAAPDSVCEGVSRARKQLVVHACVRSDGIAPVVPRRRRARDVGGRGRHGGADDGGRRRPR